MVERKPLGLADPLSIGIIGGGQLGKMIAHEAKRMSFRVIILDPTEGCPASSMADEQIVADFKDEGAIMKLAEKCDALTYEIELASSTALKQLEERQYPVRPSPEALRTIQNKYRQKSFLQHNKIPVPRFVMVKSEEHLQELCRSFGFPSVLKACEDSYDGRGNFVIRSKEDIVKGYTYFAGRECMLEEFIPFKKEVSIMVARNPSGQIEPFPLVENIHDNGILDTTIAPAQVSKNVKKSAENLAKKTLQTLNSSGIFGIEMFVTRGDKVLINEIAPRPHNSGHYTNEGCNISQFEQHLRAVFDFPLVKPELLCPTVMVNVLGPKNIDGPYAVKGIEKLFSISGVKFYLYGKKVSKPRRKLGHITATGSTIAMARARAFKGRKAIEIISVLGHG